MVLCDSLASTDDSAKDIYSPISNVFASFNLALDFKLCAVRFVPVDIALDPLYIPFKALALAVAPATLATSPAPPVIYHVANDPTL